MVPLAGVVICSVNTATINNLMFNHNKRRNALFGKFYRIAEQVRKTLLTLERDCVECREPFSFDTCILFFDHFLKFIAYPLQYVVKVGLLEMFFRTGSSRVSEKVNDQLLHLLRRFDSSFQIILACIGKCR